MTFFEMYEFRLKTESMPPYMNDVQEVVRAFSPYIVINDSADALLEIGTFVSEKGFYFFADCFSGREEYRLPSEGESDDPIEFKRRAKSAAKGYLYSYCNKLTGISLPYGSLTGVRPTAVYYRSIGSCSNIKEHLIKDYRVEPARAGLIERVVRSQEGLINRDPLRADVFANIPICPTRCSYCSFISAEYPRVRKLVPAYVEALSGDIESIRQEIVEKGYSVGAVYVGGGTPTTLDEEMLSKILPRLNFGTEFTVEAGRPDTVTESKLAVMKASGVTRVSVNPQTFSDETLSRIGRRHTASDFYRAFELARAFGFDINVDLIAGLPGEDFSDFVRSLDLALGLRPENLTVHSLSLKRGAVLKEGGASRRMDGAVKRMCDYSIEKLISSGYEPYYMYRQKNIADGLENVGYALNGKQCRYNIDYMEETTTVLSAGAGAVTKYVYGDEGRIERKSHAKGFEEYLRRAAERTKE